MKRYSKKLIQHNFWGASIYMYTKFWDIIFYLNSKFYFNLDQGF